MLTLQAILRISPSDMLSSCCCSCEQPGHKSLYIGCDLVVAAVFSSSLSAHLGLPNNGGRQTSLQCFHFSGHNFLGMGVHEQKLWSAGLLHMHLKNVQDFLIRATARYKQLDML